MASCVRKSLAETHRPFLTLLKEFSAANVSSSAGQCVLKAHADARVSVLEIDNAKRRGSISDSMMLQLASIVDELESRSDPPTALIIASKGSVFCSGLDLNLAKNCINTPERGGLMCAFMSDALDRIFNGPSVSVSVLGGPAIGGGSELVLCTDYRIMRSQMRNLPSTQHTECSDLIQKNYIQSVHARIGASPGWGGANRLTALIGRRNALRMLGTSCAVHAEEALSMGLIDEVLPNSNSSSTAFEEDISAGISFLQPWLQQRYPGSVRGIKRIVASPENTRAAVEARVFASRWFGPDNKAALGLR